MTVRIFTGLAAAAALIAAAQGAQAADACPRIEVSGPVVAGKPAAPLATLADVTSAIATKRLNGEDGVGFNVRAAAGTRLRAFTAANIGKPMTVTIDGAPHVLTIREAISGDAFWLSPMDAGQARILAGRVNNCVTP